MGSPAPNGHSVPVTPDDITRAVMAGVGAPVDEERWERRMKALTLRNAGYTFAVIAAQLGVSATVVRADCRLAMREVLSETVEEAVARQVSVLRDMQHGAYSGAMTGDKDSIMAIVRCLEQEAKLKGLYAPARLAVGISDVDFAEQAASLFEKLGHAVPKELMAHGLSDGRRVADGVGATGAPDSPAPVDVSEIIDGLVERFAPRRGADGVPEFDIPAFDLPIDGEPHEINGVSTDIGDDAIGRAAAAAIDPERFGDADSHSVNGSAGYGDRDIPGSADGWSNL